MKNVFSKREKNITNYQSIQQTTKSFNRLKPWTYFMCSLSRIHCSISAPEGKSWNCEWTSFPYFSYSLPATTFHVPRIHRTSDESNRLKCTTFHGHWECNNDWSPDLASINHPLPFLPYQLHHCAFTHTIEPQYIWILNNAAVVAVHFAPSISVVLTLLITLTLTSLTAVFAQWGSVKNSLTSPAYLVSG